MKHERRKPVVGYDCFSPMNNLFQKAIKGELRLLCHTFSLDWGGLERRWSLGGTSFRLGLGKGKGFVVRVEERCSLEGCTLGLAHLKAGVSKNSAESQQWLRQVSRNMFVLFDTNVWFQMVGTHT